MFALCIIETLSTVGINPPKQHHPFAALTNILFSSTLWYGKE